MVNFGNFDRLLDIVLPLEHVYLDLVTKLIKSGNEAPSFIQKYLLKIDVALLYLQKEKAGLDVQYCQLLCVWEHCDDKLVWVIHSKIWTNTIGLLTFQSISAHS